MGSLRWFRHGELHLALLALLHGRPMHGYELMSELGARLGGYRPSPGSIYPAVQALESEGLIRAVEDGDRRVYGLTAEGTKALARRMHKVAALEGRLGTRFHFGVEAALARFGERVRAVPLDDEDLEAFLEETATAIEEQARRGGKR